MATHVLDSLQLHNVTGDQVRLVDLQIRPGVSQDMGHGDEWPDVRAQMMAADIVVLATPTWLGQMSSVAKRALERLSAEISATDDKGRPATFGKVAVVAVVGNEDGAHRIVADVFQGLNDCGFTVPAQGCTYWNGEAMTLGDYNDLAAVPDAVAAATATMARNAAHLARLLHESPYFPAE